MADKVIRNQITSDGTLRTWKFPYSAEGGIPPVDKIEYSEKKIELSNERREHLIEIEKRIRIADRKIRGLK